MNTFYKKNQSKFSITLVPSKSEKIFLKFVTYITRMNV